MQTEEKNLTSIERPAEEPVQEAPVAGQAAESAAKAAKPVRVKDPASTVALRWVARVLMIVWSVLIIYPLFWTLITSFKNSYQFMSDPWALPSRWMYSNYVDAWIDASFADYFMNSVYVTLGALVLTVIMVSTSSYVIAKYRHPVIRFLERFYALFMMAPQVLLLIPLMYLCLKFNLTNLVTLMVLYAIQSVPFYCFMMVPFVRGIDDAFLEAAQIDGANEFYVFVKIILPMAVPAVAMVALLSVVGSWNEYMVAITLIKDPKYYTLPAGINNITSSAVYSYGVKFAALIISMIPVLIIYAIFQKPLQNGLSAGDGVKG